MRTDTHNFFSQMSRYRCLLYHRVHARFEFEVWHSNLHTSITYFHNSYQIHQGDNSDTICGKKRSFKKLESSESVCNNSCSLTSIFFSKEIAEGFRWILQLKNDFECEKIAIFDGFLDDVGTRYEMIYSSLLISRTLIWMANLKLKS